MNRRFNTIPCARTGARYVASAAKVKPRNWFLNSEKNDLSQQFIASEQSFPLDSTAYTSFQESSRHNEGFRSREHVRNVTRQQNYDLVDKRDKPHSQFPCRSQYGEGPRSLVKPLRGGALDKWKLPLKPATETQNTLPIENSTTEVEILPSSVASPDTCDARNNLWSSSNNAIGNERKRIDRNPRESPPPSSGLERQRSNYVPGSKKVESHRGQGKSRMKNSRGAGTQQADVYIPSTITVGNLARLLSIRLGRLQRQMKLAGMGDDVSHDYVLAADYAALLVQEFGRNPIVSDEAAFDLYPPPPHPNPATLPLRPPVVAIMGHVDHGKTTLLDTLRLTSVAKGEAGGITQHIGAFSVPVPGSGGTDSITFLDTPGHAAFSAMRARGARVTDIVILVVAADDGIMPQTREVIDLLKKEEGKIGVVIAINKVDKPGVDIDGVQKSLLAEGLQLESFGGDIPCVPVSGLTGQGLTELVETILAIAEMQDLRAEHDGSTHGYILESKVQKGLGPVATALVLRGCLKTGSHIVSGVSHAKVRLMKDAAGLPVKVAHPGMAVAVSGWRSLPSAGDEVLQGSEAEVKKAIANRERKIQLDALLSEVDVINESRRQEKDRRTSPIVDKPPDQDHVGPKELRLIVKADVSGSMEAVVGAMQGIGNDKTLTKIVFSGVGDISEADVMMAKTVGGTIIGFSVAVPRVVQTQAARSGVPICTSDVIYSLMDDVKQRVIDLLPTSIETTVTGEATVLQLFEIQVKAKQTKNVAGCRVINGVVDKAQLARVVRNGSVIHEGHLETIRHLKKDVTEVRKGSECGLSICDFPDLQQGDLIQIFKRIEKPGVL